MVLYPNYLRRRQRFGFSLAVLILLVLAFVTRFVFLSGHPFHPDEALYATWARLIATGEDPLLSSKTVDKPPLLLYLVAIPFGTLGASEEAARVPNVLAGTLTVAAIALLGAEMFRDRRVGWLAGLLAALSPMGVLFSTTVFADPLMVLWLVAAALAACSSRTAVAGLFLGLAWATKPDAVMFGPIILWQAVARALPDYRAAVGKFAAGTFVPIVAVFVWSAIRQAPDYLQASLANFGGVALETPHVYGAKLGTWVGYARTLTAEPLLALALLSIPLGLWRDRKMLTLLAFGTGWIVLHLVVSFPAWDRYALPLVPIAALLTARGIVWLLDKLSDRRRRAAALSLVALAVCFPIVSLAAGTVPTVARDARQEGIGTVGEFFWKTDTTATILYYHGLGWEIEYYTFGRVLDRRWFASEEALAADALHMQHATRYVLLGAWENLEDRFCETLRSSRLRADVVFEGVDGFGAPTITLYRIRDAAD